MTTNLNTTNSGLDRIDPPQPVTVGKDFVLAGRAVFTLIGARSRFTYRVTRKDPTPDDPRPTVYFVSLLTGTDNENDYSYLGLLDHRTGQVRLTKASRMTDQAPAVQAIRWVFRHLWATGTVPAPAAIIHEGRCGRCGRTLTVPESVLTGFGPECAAKLGIQLDLGLPVQTTAPAPDFTGFAEV